MTREHQREIRRTAAAGLLILAVIASGLFLDLATPFVQVGGVVYLGLIVAAFWLPWYQAPLVLAIVGTILIAIGYPYAAAIDSHWLAAGSRGLAIGGLWFAALLLGRCRTAATDRDRAAHLSALIDTTADGVILIDAAGTVQDFNPACERLFGYRADEVVGHNVNMLMPSPYREEHDGYLQHYHQTGERRVIGIGRIVEGRRKDASIFPMQLLVGETRQGNERVFVGTIRDLTEKESAELALRRAIEQAEAANRAKSLFLANMTHELRTPMNAVLGYAQIMRNDPTIPDGHRQAVNAIMNAGNHLMDLINDVLDLSKIEAGAMELNKTDFSLWELSEGLADIFRVRCEEQGIGWRVENGVDEAVVVEGDHKKLRQVLINLLGNAVKFTDAGEVVLRLSRSGDAYLFEVIDTGPGISPEAHEKIFEPFQQAEEGVHKGGTGLGLTIAARHIALMGGELAVDTRPGEGSRFHFTLALPEVQGTDLDHGAGRERVIGLAPGSGIEALVVDDVADNRAILSQMLAAIGVEVRTAVDGRQAIDRIHEQRPDIVFMDIRMPVMDGMEALAELRGSPDGRDLVCIAVTAAGMLHQSDHFLAAGFDDVVTKPFHFERIYECMTSHLGTRFVYETQDGAGSRQGRTPVDLATMVLPADIHRRLRKAAQVNAFTEIDAILTEVEAADHGAADLASHLRALLSRYDSDGILAALEAVRHE